MHLNLPCRQKQSHIFSTNFSPILQHWCEGSCNQSVDVRFHYASNSFAFFVSFGYYALSFAAIWTGFALLIFAAVWARQNKLLLYRLLITELIIAWFTRWKETQSCQFSSVDRLGCYIAFDSVFWSFALLRKHQSVTDCRIVYYGEGFLRLFLLFKCFALNVLCKCFVFS